MSGENSLTREEVMDWVRGSCAAQGVPLLVVDQEALRQVGVLLGMDSQELNGSDAVGTSSARAERARRTTPRSRDDRAS